MSQFGNNWATSYKNSRAIFAAISLSVLLIWALTLKQQDDARIYLRTDKVVATVQDISTTEIDSRYGGKSITYFATLELPEGKKIRFILPRSPPKIGSKVPVLIDIYDDGSSYYHYNHIEWQLL